MPSQNSILFSYVEVVEALIKQAKVHEGIWAIQVQFSMQAMNINMPTGLIAPGVVMPIAKLGIQLAEEEKADWTVDAAKVNTLLKSVK